MRAIRLGEAAIHRGTLDEFEGYFADDVFFESRRKILGVGRAELRSGEWPREARISLEMGETVVHRHVVVAVLGERLALCRAKLGTSDVSPGAPRDELLHLMGIDADSRFALEMWFDGDDIDAALAELDAAHTRFEKETPDNA